MAASLDDRILELRARHGSDADPSGRMFAPLAEALLQAGRIEEATSVVSEGLVRLPDFATGRLVAAWIHEARGDHSTAEEHFREALALDPLNVRVLRDLGRIRRDAGAPDEAEQLFSRAATVDGGPLEEDERPPVVMAVEDVEGVLTPELEEWLMSEGGIDPLPGDELPMVAGLADLSAATPEAGALPLEVGPLDLQEEEEALPPLPEADPEWFDGSWEAEGAADEPPFPGDEVQTRTIAELYVSQGLLERGIQVYRDLVEVDPLDEGLVARLAELEAGLSGGTTGEEPEEEAAAPDAGEGPDPLMPGGEPTLEEAAAVFLEPPEGLEVSSPFTWTGGVEPDVGEEGTSTPEVPVADYLTSILEWTPPTDVEGGPGTAPPESPPMEDMGLPEVVEGGADVDLSPSRGLEGLPIPTLQAVDPPTPERGAAGVEAPDAPWGSQGNPVPVEALHPGGEVPVWVPVESLAPDGHIPTWVDIRSLAPDADGGGAAGEEPPPVSSSDADFRAWLEQLRQ